MVTSPKLLPSGATVGDVRRLFTDDHVHLALLVGARRLVSTVERIDIPPTAPSGALAASYGTLVDRTTTPEALARNALDVMRGRGQRRLAVIDEHGSLRGLLCLKRHGQGFCSDADVERRRRDPS
jgi:hypothetical protein